jgi:hypothetical protein
MLGDLSNGGPSFRGGICRTGTHLRQLETDVRSHDSTTTILMEQARMRASILRLLLTGRLLTRDVVTRHRANQTTECGCQLGGPQTIEHISWSCSHHTDKRQPVHDLLPCIMRAKPCFKYATLLMPADADLASNLSLIQAAIVDIWQDNIHMYLQGEHPLDPPDSPDTSSSQPSSHTHSISDSLHQNGHFIVGIPCGDEKEYVAGNARSLSLKFATADSRYLRTKCTQATLPETQWLDRFWLLTQSSRSSRSLHGHGALSCT